MLSKLKETQTNSTIDIMKFVMAILVVGIHTEPFGFNIWLDRGFGIITRLCVPFFFITSSYFFWKKEKSICKYLIRIAVLYTVWSIIYLPYDFSGLKNDSSTNIILRYFWYGNEHALWYLCGSIIGMLCTYALYRIFNKKTAPVLIASIMVLFIGCLLSTYSPLFYKIIGIKEYVVLNCRNGLFYAFPYTSMGLIIAKKKTKNKALSKSKLMAGFIISLFVLAIESYLFVSVLKTKSTILWMSVLPCSYFLFLLLNEINIPLPKKESLFIRELSSLIYLCHGIFLILYNEMHTLYYFLFVLLSSLFFSIVIIIVSRRKNFRWLQYLY